MKFQSLFYYKKYINRENKMRKIILEFYIYVYTESRVERERGERKGIWLTEARRRVGVILV